MAGSASIERAFTDELERLLAEYPGVSYEIETTSKHKKLRLHYEGRSKLVVMSSTTNDRRAVKNRICDTKRMLRELLDAQVCNA